MSPTTPLRLALLASLLLPACTPQPTYSVRRAALVPIASPVLWNGQGAPRRDSATPDRRVVEGHASAATTLGRPSDPDDSDGLQIPALNLDAGGRAWLSDDVAIGLLVSYAPLSGSRKLAADQPEVESSAGAIGVGSSAILSLPLTEQLRLGLAGEAMIYSVPTVEYRTCVSNCEGVPEVSSVEYASELVLGGAFAIIPSYRQGAWTFHAGVTLRSHPTIRRADLEVGADDADDEEVTWGGLVTIVSAGVDVALGRGTRLGLVGFQATGDQPLRYDPGLAVVFTAHR